jgi:trk system potassium uptake protein TrkH
MNKNVVDEEIVNGVNTYLVVFCVLFISSTLLISINGFDFATIAYFVISCLKYVGPVLKWLDLRAITLISARSQSLFSALICLRRLELFPILICLILTLIRNN